MKQSRSWILVITSSLAGIGLVMVFSSSAVHAERFGSATHLLVRQAIWLGLGLVAMYVGWKIDYRFYLRYWKILLGITVVILAAVLIPGVGTRFNGARRWIRVMGFGLQPSEFAKIGLVAFVAAYLARYHKQLGDFVKGFLPVAAVVALIFALVALEPDAGTALLLAAVAFLMLLVGGIRIKHLVPIALASAPVVALAIFTKYEYIERRVMAYLHPEAYFMAGGYQARQSILALGAGGAFGRGLGDGLIKNHFLPEAYSDFILSIVGEEFGFAGTLLVIALFVGLIYHGMKVAQTCPDRFGFLLVFGLTMLIGLQAATNIAVVTASVPTKGISLPLVSYGGSSLVATMLSLGIILNVTRAGESVEDRDREFVEICSMPQELVSANELEAG